MSLKDYLKFLQNLITMLDPNDKQSCECFENALRAVFQMMRMSGKADGITMEHAWEAQLPHSVHALIRMRDEFAGVPGEYEKNKKKRERLLHVIAPHC